MNFTDLKAFPPLPVSLLLLLHIVIIVTLGTFVSTTPSIVLGSFLSSRNTIGARLVQKSPSSRLHNRLPPFASRTAGVSALNIHDECIFIISRGWHWRNLFALLNLSRENDSK